MAVARAVRPGAWCNDARPRTMRRLKFVLLAAGTGCAAWLAWASRPQPAPPPAPAVPALAAALRTVDRIELRHGGALLTLEQRGRLWYLAQHGGYPAHSERASALLDQLAAMRLVARAPGVMESLDLDDPAKPGGHSTAVRVLNVAGRSVGSLVLGRRYGPRQAVRRPNDFEAWTADRAIDADTALDGWTDPLILPPGTPAVAAAVLERPNEPPTPLAAGDVAGLDGVTFSDVRPAVQTHATPSALVHYTLADGTAVDASLGTADDRIWVQFAAAGPGADAINQRVRGWSYAVIDAEAKLMPHPDPVPASQ